MCVCVSHCPRPEPEARPLSRSCRARAGGKRQRLRAAGGSGPGPAAPGRVCAAPAPQGRPAGGEGGSSGCRWREGRFGAAEEPSPWHRLAFWSERAWWAPTDRASPSGPRSPQLKPVSHTLGSEVSPGPASPCQLCCCCPQQPRLLWSMLSYSIYFRLLLFSCNKEVLLLSIFVCKSRNLYVRGIYLTMFRWESTRRHLFSPSHFYMITVTGWHSVLLT